MDTLRLGSRGSDVYTLQRLLAASPAVNDLVKFLVIDGKFGIETKKAVELFQMSNGLKKDGIVGPQTWGLLSPPLDPPDVPPVPQKPYKHPPWYRGIWGWLLGFAAFLGLLAAF